MSPVFSPLSFPTTPPEARPAEHDVAGGARAQQLLTDGSAFPFPLLVTPPGTPFHSQVPRLEFQGVSAWSPSTISTVDGTPSTAMDYDLDVLEDGESTARCSYDFNLDAATGLAPPTPVSIASPRSSRRISLSRLSVHEEDLDCSITASLASSMVRSSSDPGALRPLPRPSSPLFDATGKVDLVAMIDDLAKWDDELVATSDPDATVRLKRSTSDSSSEESLFSYTSTETGSPRLASAWMPLDEEDARTSKRLRL